jgi:hypothetical protein
LAITGHKPHYLNTSFTTFLTAATQNSAPPALADNHSPDKKQRQTNKQPAHITDKIGSLHFPVNSLTNISPDL